MPIDSAESDRLHQAYKAAVDQWIAPIRKEDALATPDYCPPWERRDQASFKEQKALDMAAKEVYKEALRKRDYGF